MAKINFKIPKNQIATGKKRAKEASGNPELAPGYYPALLTDIRPVNNKCVMDFTVGENEQDENSKGAKVSLWFDFDEDKIGFFFRALSAMGIDTNDMSSDKEINSALEELLGEAPVVRLKCVHKGDYCNYFITKLLEDMTAADLNLDEEDALDDGEEDEEEGEEDELDDMNRSELKKFIKDEELEIVIKKSMSDDDIRIAIRKELD